ncbi:MAG: hypothetical protein JO119_02695 [Acidobacteria bacterium]|nr:hypothetical protein [Acidobacteriota bacterium]
MSWFRYIDALSSVANPGQRRENQPIEPVRLEVLPNLSEIRTVVRSGLSVVRLCAAT